MEEGRSMFGCGCGNIDCFLCTCEEGSVELKADEEDERVTAAYDIIGWACSPQFPFGGAVVLQKDLFVVRDKETQAWVYVRCIHDNDSDIPVGNSGYANEMRVCSGCVPNAVEVAESCMYHGSDDSTMRSLRKQRTCAHVISVDIVEDSIREALCGNHVQSPQCIEVRTEFRTGGAAGTVRVYISFAGMMDGSWVWALVTSSSDKRRACPWRCDHCTINRCPHVKQVEALEVGSIVLHDTSQQSLSQYIPERRKALVEGTSRLPRARAGRGGAADHEEIITRVQARLSAAAEGNGSNDEKLEDTQVIVAVHGREGKPEDVSASSSFSACCSPYT